MWTSHKFVTFQAGGANRGTLPSQQLQWLGWWAGKSLTGMKLSEVKLSSLGVSVSLNGCAVWSCSNSAVTLPVVSAAGGSPVMWWIRGHQSELAEPSSISSVEAWSSCREHRGGFSLSLEMWLHCYKRQIEDELGFFLSEFMKVDFEDKMNCLMKFSPWLTGLSKCSHVPAALEH